jgi:hypothetical protein
MARTTTSTRPRSSPNSAPSQRSRLCSTETRMNLVTSAVASVVSTSVPMKTSRNAPTTRNSGRMFAGKVSESGVASRLAARNAMTQPASESTSCTSPRHAPQAIESSSSAMTP